MSPYPPLMGEVLTEVLGLAHETPGAGMVPKAGDTDGSVMIKRPKVMLTAVNLSWKRLLEGLPNSFMLSIALEIRSST